MTESAQPTVDSDDGHVVLTGVTTTELGENMKTAKFTEGATAALMEVTTRILEVADEVVAKTELQPEFEYILLRRKSAGSPFFSVEVGMASSVTPDTVTTIADRSEKLINARRMPKKRLPKLRAVDITSDTDS